MGHKALSEAQLRVLKLNIANVIPEKERKKQRSSDEAIFLCFVIQWGVSGVAAILCLSLERTAARHWKSVANKC